MKSFIELWKTFAALHASCRIFWRSHFPRLTNSPTRIMPLMIFRLQVSFQQMIIRSISMIVVTITKSWIMLKISGSICATPNSNAAPKIRNAMFITMLSKRKVTRLALLYRLSHLVLCLLCILGRLLRLRTQLGLECP